MQPPFRVGTGYDIHQLVEGYALVLGWRACPVDGGLQTLTPMVTCSVMPWSTLWPARSLTATWERTFPRMIRTHEDARSLDFVEQFARHVRATGYEIANVDCFVVLGTIKLRPHLDAMRRNLAEALDVDVKQVSVKARSNDGLGEEGQGRACAAWATVLIYPASD